MLARKVVSLSGKAALYELLADWSTSKSSGYIHGEVNRLLAERGVGVGVNGDGNLSVYLYGKSHEQKNSIGFMNFKLEQREAEKLINMSIMLKQNRRGFSIGPLLCAFVVTHPQLSELFRHYVIQSDYSFKASAIRALSNSGMFDIFRLYVGDQYRAQLKQELRNES